MNEQLQTALVNLLDKTVNGIDSSVAFMQAELPDVINQLLTWYVVESAIYFLLGMAIFFVPIFLVKKHCTIGRGIKEDSNHYNATLTHDKYGSLDVGFILASAFIIPIWLITSSNLIFSSLDWLKIWIAPKIWLIEYAATLTK